MSRTQGNKTVVTILAIAAFIASAYAQDFDLGWFTIDGGGGSSAGGDFELGGTIGQPDGGSLDVPMTGGDFVLVGGFWPVAAGCACPGDLSGDQRRDGSDIAGFVGCLLETGSNCACADLDANGALTMADVALFVQVLLSGAACP